jgi:cytidine deaminase
MMSILFILITFTKQVKILEKTVKIHLTRFQDFSEVPDKYKEILDAASHALHNSYAPYSTFRVGACILLDNGNRILGTNIENASYPLCMCAERNAVAKLSFEKPMQKIMAVAVVADKKNVMVSPCGACRQVLVEMESIQKSPIEIIFQGEEGSYYLLDSIKSLLPFSFSADALPKI